MSENEKPQEPSAVGSNLSAGLGGAWEETLEHLKLLDIMEGQQLPTELDQDARDLHRLIRDHAWRYKETEFGDMTLPLARSLTRLVCAAAMSRAQRPELTRAGRRSLTGPTSEASEG